MEHFIWGGCVAIALTVAGTNIMKGNWWVAATIIITAQHFLV